MLNTLLRAAWRSRIRASKEVFVNATSVVAWDMPCPNRGIRDVGNQVALYVDYVVVWGIPAQAEARFNYYKTISKLKDANLNLLVENRSRINRRARRELQIQIDEGAWAGGI